MPEVTPSYELRKSQVRGFAWMSPLRWQWCLLLPEDQNKTRWRCRVSWQFFRCYPLINIQKKNYGKSWKIRIFDGINYFDWAMFYGKSCRLGHFYRENPLFYGHVQVHKLKTFTRPGHISHWRCGSHRSHLLTSLAQIFPGMNDPTPVILWPRLLY